MFEAITKKRKNRVINYIGWGMLTVVCVVFIFIGYDFNQNFLGTTGAAAEVNGDAISVKAFSELVDRLEQQGGRSDVDSQKQLRKDALNILVDQQLVYQKSNELNIFVSDGEVADFLMEQEGLHENGKFSLYRYKAYLASQRTSEEEFENRIRMMLLQRKLIRLIGYVAKPIPLVEEIDKKIEKAKINISYLAFNKYNSKTVSVPADKDVADYLAANEAKIKEYYEKNKSKEFTEKEKVKARHILVKFEEDKPESEEAARKKIDEIKAQVTVANFSEVAKKESQDPGSAARGGDLGYFPRGRMVPSFEEVAFSSEKGVISEPVKSKFGYHIILVDDKQSEQLRDFDSVKKDIAANMLRDQGFDKLEADMRTALKAGDLAKVDEIANLNGLKWKDTGLYSINEEYVPGVGQIQPFIDGTMELSKAEPISKDLIPYMNNRYILKLKEAKIDDSSKEPIDNKLAFLQRMMEQNRVHMVMKNWIDSLKKDAKIKVNTSLIN